MPRYYFDTDDGADLVRDEIGTELLDDQAARDEGSRFMAEMARTYLPGGPPQKNITIWVRNEENQAVLQLALSFAIMPVRDI